MSKSIWQTLSEIDCSKHIEKKGKFSYLAWTWAWAMVKDKYPLSRYKLEDDIVYSDGTMEVRVEVEVVDDKSILSHTMWLPVLDYQNKPIANPNAFDINTARMRCLVKCLAMFGLGHYIYAGESAPQEPDYQAEHDAAVKAHMTSVKYIREALDEDRYESAYEAWSELDEDTQRALWRAPTKGGKAFSTAQIAKMKSNEWGQARLAMMEK